MTIPVHNSMEGRGFTFTRIAVLFPQKPPFIFLSSFFFHVPLVWLLIFKVFIVLFFSLFLSWQRNMVRYKKAFGRREKVKEKKIVKKKKAFMINLLAIKADVFNFFQCDHKNGEWKGFAFFFFFFFFWLTC